ncbi:putative sugar transporter [Trypanosoma rangeli]|uniref:Putative sugar transporter n=1 Tax=Trypanosoma rangeli TaxID=5698 RepID=A0A3R7MGQ7_TRYRA|nr:putative sugar transporter [Trypanosoma rangeli]RNF02221.1 putative sugar transporter [Trypanosoma rangeli]|eukprot:RNF02221.1 putative sugar transporter [Trypanosoma rangeli]
MRLSIKLFAALGGFLFGYDTSVINGALFQIKDWFEFSGHSWKAGLIVSIAVAGAFVGAFIPGLLATRCGRRACIAIADVFFIAGSIIMAVAMNVEMLLVGRAVVGLGIGMSSVTVPVYLSEITSARERGATVVFNGVSLTGAQCVASAVTALLVQFTSTNVGWRVALGLGALPAIIQLVGLFIFLPESPRWLLVKGDRERALKLAEEFEVDICEVTDNDNSEAFAPNYRGIFEKGMRRRLLIGCMLHVLQQISGINTIMYYSSVILYDAGFRDPKTPVIFSIPLAGINAISTMCCLFTVDRWGRRRLLQVSAYACLAITISMTAVGFCLGTQVTYSIGGWVFLALLGVYLVFFAPGLGAMPWVVMGEIFPNRLRITAASVATMCNWGSNALVSQLFPIMMGSIGVGGTFSVICGCIAFAAVFIQFFVVETKGLTLEEIEDFFDGKRAQESTGETDATSEFCNLTGNRMVGEKVSDARERNASPFHNTVE